MQRPDKRGIARVDDNSLKRYKPEQLKSLIGAVKEELARRETDLEAQREDVERVRDEADPPACQAEEEQKKDVSRSSVDQVS